VGDKKTSIAFTFFQQVFGHLLKEGKASGGCHGIEKEFLGGC